MRTTTTTSTTSYSRPSLVKSHCCRSQDWHGAKNVTPRGVMRDAHHGRLMLFKFAKFEIFWSLGGKPRCDVLRSVREISLINVHLIAMSCLFSFPSSDTTGRMPYVPPRHLVYSTLFTYKTSSLADVFVFLSLTTVPNSFIYSVAGQWIPILFPTFAFWD